MQTPKFVIKFVLNIFPPLLFNRIVLKEISDDFLEMKVVLKRTLFNVNFHKTIFGGSIFSACDPYFPIMYYHIFKEKKLIVWVKNAEIQYLSPATTTLNLNFKISNDQIEKIKNGLKRDGKYEIQNEVFAIDKKDNICAQAKINVYLRDPNFVN